ncbi:MAG: hypothetical protein ACOY3P_20215 [Planctomycetota bacterium]
MKRMKPSEIQPGGWVRAFAPMPCRVYRYGLKSQTGEAGAPKLCIESEWIPTEYVLDDSMEGKRFPVTLEVLRVVYPYVTCRHRRTFTAVLVIDARVVPLGAAEPKGGAA